MTTTSGQQPQRSVEEQIRAYLQVLKQDPRSRVFAPLAQLLLECGFALEAEKVCRRGVKEHPGFSEGFLVLARILRARGQKEEARQQLRQALDLNPQDIEAHLLEAEMLREAGDREGAVQACMRILDLQPREARAISLLGVLGMQQRAQRLSSLSQVRGAVATAPGRRAAGQGAELSPASLFGEELGEVSDQAIARVDGGGQPFAALSSGSQPPPPREGDDFSVPTAKDNRRPEIPAQPAVAPVAAPVVPAVEEPRSGSLLSVAYIQSVVQREGRDSPQLEGERLRVPRGGRLLMSMALLLAFVVVGLIIRLSLNSTKRTLPIQPADAAAAEPQPEPETLPSQPPFATEALPPEAAKTPESPAAADEPPAAATPLEVKPAGEGGKSLEKAGKKNRLRKTPVKKAKRTRKKNP